MMGQRESWQQYSAFAIESSAETNGVISQAKDVNTVRHSTLHFDIRLRDCELTAPSSPTHTLHISSTHCSKKNESSYGIYGI
jgi:hypothetical protein